MTYCDDIEAHYDRVWARRLGRFDWIPGQRRDLPPGFAVLSFERSPEMRAFATRCMSQSGDPSPLELHLFSRVADAQRYQPELVELLTAVAHYHRTGAPLGLGHSVNFGRPWLPGSTCSYGLVSLPYLDGPRLEWLDRPKVRFLWLIPITDTEVDFKRKRGLEALEQRLEESHFDYLDPRRPSAC